MLFDSDLHPTIQQKLTSIGHFYFEDTEEKTTRDGFSLLAGDSGIILIYSLLLQTTKDPKFKKAIDDNLEKVIQQIESLDRLFPTFCNGLAGIGWLFLYLTEKKIIDIDSDAFLEDVDMLLEAELENMLAEKNFDILHGAIGVGIYFLKRNKGKTVEKIVEALEQSSIVINDEIIWNKLSDEQLIYDFGLAHGNASMIYFLAKCFDKQISPDKCLRLINGNFNFFMANIQDIRSVGSFFPSIKPAEDYKISEAPKYSRLAWCYGDAGILHTLFLAATIIKDEGRTEKVLRMLEVVSKRRTQPITGVIDAGFCHGSSGVGYIYLNLYKKTGNAIFKDTAQYWLDQTVNFAKAGQGTEGYLFNFSKSGLQPQTNILNGLGGVGLFYLSALNDELNPDWNECFFLS